jgi:hypothetical protein
MNRPNFCLIPLLIVFVVCLSLLSGAQDKFKSGEAPESQNLKYKTDLEFAQFLRHEWMKMEMLPGLEPDKTPKPVVMPVAEVTPEAEESLKSTFTGSRKVERIAFVPPPPPEPPETTFEEVVEPTRDYITLEYAFYSSPVEIEYDPELKVYIGNSINAPAIADFWERIAQAEYVELLAQANHYRIRYGLNDWGFAMFLYQMGEEIYRSDNGASLFTWYMLVKAGYDARVGYEKDRIYLLLPAQNYLYGLSYFSIGGESYYVASFATDREVKSLHIYQEAYPGADRFLKVRVRRPPDIAKRPKSRTLTFEDMGQQHTLSVEYNESVMDFFNEYPQTDLEVYFGSSVSRDVAESLVSGLKPLIEGKSEAEAVNLLLHFVQTGFDYKTDGEQFGREKYFFPEETFFYSYCDCEDRSVLFAYLVSHLLGLEVIGLDYPGHVATGVKFNDPIPGDSVTHHGQKYIICDPTYINSNIGMCMTGFKSVPPRIIQIQT